MGVSRGADARIRTGDPFITRERGSARGCGDAVDRGNALDGDPHDDAPNRRQVVVTLGIRWFGRVGDPLHDRRRRGADVLGDDLHRPRNTADGAEARGPSRIETPSRNARHPSPSLSPQEWRPTDGRRRARSRRVIAGPAVPRDRCHHTDAVGIRGSLTRIRTLVTPARPLKKRVEQRPVASVYQRSDPVYPRRRGCDQYAYASKAGLGLMGLTQPFYPLWPLLAWKRHRRKRIRRAHSDDCAGERTAENESRYLPSRTWTTLAALAWICPFELSLPLLAARAPLSPAFSSLTSRRSLVRARHRPWLWKPNGKWVPPSSTPVARSGGSRSVRLAVSPRPGVGSESGFR
jgi:hypothetical protein